MILRPRLIYAVKAGVSSMGRGDRKSCAVLSLLLIVLLFGDVLFRRASLAAIDYTDILTNPVKSPRSVSWLFPERKGRTILHGQGDVGAAAYQFEPSIQFMAFCIRHGESPFWDPYTATGALGPESMVDIKFSAFSVVTALLGGGSQVISLALVFLFWLACYCLMRCCCIELQLSTMGAFGACCVFLLNGFAVTNLYTQIGQPYFLAPILLRSMLLFTGKPTARNAGFALIANIAFFSTTFFPTLVLSGIAVYSLSLGLRLGENRKNWRRLILIHAVLPAAAALCLAFLYWPILAAQYSYLDTVQQYQERLTPGYSLVNLLSLFTPKHFWEYFRAMIRPSAPPAEAYSMLVDYLGVAATLIATHCVFCARRLRLPAAVLGFCALAAVGQMFGIFPFTLIDHLPFFSFVRNEYWPCLASLALVFLTGIGLDAVTGKHGFSRLAMLLLGIIACSFFYLLGHVGYPSDPIIRTYIAALFCIAAAASGLLMAGGNPRFSLAAKAGLTVLLLAEGVFYMNNLRPYRSRNDDRLAPAFMWLKSEVQNHPGSRVLNLGLNSLYPDWGSALQIPELGNLNASELPWYRDFYDRYIGNGLFLSLGSPADKSLFTDPSLAVAGVRYIVVDRSFAAVIERLKSLNFPIARQDSVRLIFENPNPLARCFVVAGVEKADGLPSDFGYPVRAIGSTMDEKFLRAAQALGIPLVGTGADDKQAERSLPGSVELTEYHHTVVRLHSIMRQPGAIILADSWTPNWKAFVDGRATAVAKMDVAFRGVMVPAGSHDIVFRYENKAVLLGKLVSALSCLASLAVLWFWRRREMVLPA